MRIARDGSAYDLNPNPNPTPNPTPTPDPNPNPNTNTNPTPTPNPNPKQAAPTTCNCPSCLRRRRGARKGARCALPCGQRRVAQDMERL
eukprot:scaffold36982_cov52-Phaeocystis_antarctica.AAC.2